MELSIDKASAEIDRFIDGRSEALGAERQREQLWKASVREFHRKRHEVHRQEWLAYHDRMQRLHTQLANSHAAKAEALQEADLKEIT